MLSVPNRGCILRLGFRTLRASGKRNRIAVLAIAMTTLLFTALFTIMMTINESYQEYQFRQIGGYEHGSFKDVTDEQIEAISAHPLVKEAGVRRIFGMIEDGVFSQEAHAELSFMDDNTARWSYAVPTTGRAPETGKEIATDTRVLELLGIEPVPGAQVPLTYKLLLNGTDAGTVTDTFILTGFWEYDSMIPVHFINVSEEYAKEAGGSGSRADLGVMMRSSFDIYGQMVKVDEDLGYDPESRDGENSARIGVNWGYTSTQIDNLPDLETALSLVAFLVLVIITGFLIINNIFQISIAGDIRSYGLLKTIGVTPRQLKRIVRIQALSLCIPGIPMGLLAGYLTGTMLTPVALSGTAIEAEREVRSTSPWIFILSAIFAVVTVFLSCRKPARMAAKVSPVEAVRFSGESAGRRVLFSDKRHGLQGMALANLGRNRRQTVMVLLSLALSVVLLQLLLSFVGGFDIEKYLSKVSGADFIVSSPEYFRYERVTKRYFSDDTKEKLDSLGERADAAGFAGKNSGVAGVWMREDAYLNDVAQYAGMDAAEASMSVLKRKDGFVLGQAAVESFEPELFQMLGVLEGDMAPLMDPTSRTIAVVAEVDDYGRIDNPDKYPAVGEKVTVVYAEDAMYIDSRTGDFADDTTPADFIREELVNEKDVEYTVCALINVPYSLGMRFYTPGGYIMALSAEALGIDSGLSSIPMLWAADMGNQDAEIITEKELSEWMAEDSSIKYESKETARADFEGFRRMFTLMGGALCCVVALVGVLNFINAVMTGIIERQHEFAVLQAVGMTGRQLTGLLIREGILYTTGAVVFSLILIIILSPFTGRLMEEMFWFYSSRFSFNAVLLAAPMFFILGFVIPAVLYRRMAGKSIVERLRDSER